MIGSAAVTALLAACTLRCADLCGSCGPLLTQLGMQQQRPNLACMG